MPSKFNFILFFICLGCTHAYAQEYGDFSTIKKEKLLNDLEIVYQALDKFHSGMYWYTPKDSVDMAFQEVRTKINQDMNVLEFHKHIAPLVALARENHTSISMPEDINKKIVNQTAFLPMTVVFLGTELYCLNNGSALSDLAIEGQEIELINGEKPTAIVDKIGSLLNTDGYIQSMKYTDLSLFNFARYYFYYYGEVAKFEIKFKNSTQPLTLQAEKIEDIRKNLQARSTTAKATPKKDLLDFQLLNPHTAYLGIHSFSNSDIKAHSKEKNIKDFLENSFKSIAEHEIKNLIIDVSQNGGGTEGNEGLLYSYLGPNYQKYIKVRAKTQRATLDNGIDPPIKLKTFGFIERTFVNKKKKDGSLERREWIGEGLMAYQKEPKNKFSGKLYVIISPLTYSGGSEFCNMVFTNDLATFVGFETGGGYYGNTSGYSKEITLPNSKIVLDIPALQFVMNVKPKLPLGRGVLPDYEVIPTFEQYSTRENPALSFILELLKKQN